MTLKALWFNRPNKLPRGIAPEELNLKRLKNAYCDFK